MTDFPNLLPRTDMTIDDARRKLAGYHFAKEALSEGEREILYVAEGLLRELDRLYEFSDRIAAAHELHLRTGNYARLGMAAQDALRALEKS